MNLHIAARQYLEVPFGHQGRNPSVAIDCIGLLVLALRDCGWQGEEHAADYARDPHEGQLEARLEAEFGPPLSKSDMQPGDIVALRFRGPIRHVGIIGDYPQGGLSLIHTDSQVKKVTEHRIDKLWLRCIKRVHRVGMLP